MCGRYVSPDEASIEREFNLVHTEWQVQSAGKTAGLWDVSKTDAGDRIESVTHITLPANKLLGEIHNAQQRMPAILAKDDRDAWLAGSPDEAWATLKPYPDEHLVAWAPSA